MLVGEGDVKGRERRLKGSEADRCVVLDCISETGQIVNCLGMPYVSI